MAYLTSHPCRPCGAIGPSTTHISCLSNSLISRENNWQSYGTLCSGTTGHRSSCVLQSQEHWEILTFKKSGKHENLFWSRLSSILRFWLPRIKSVRSRPESEIVLPCMCARIQNRQAIYMYDVKSFFSVEGKRKVLPSRWNARRLRCVVEKKPKNEKFKTSLQNLITASVLVLVKSWT